MNPIITRSVLVSLGLASGILAQENTAASTSTPATKASVAKAHDTSSKTEEADQEKASKGSEEEKSKKLTKEEKRQAEMKKEQSRLALENALADEKLKKETAKYRAEITRLKTEKELMTERLALAAVKRKTDQEAEAAKTEIEISRLKRKAAIAQATAESLTHELKAAQAQAGIEVTKLQGEIQSIEIEAKRKGFADATPVYLKNPLKEDGILVISDRRIALNGAITGTTADYITQRIHYFNNQDSELPLFIVIDECPGGSVMAGYRILKAMEASDAPIHVVVKSFAASMAAAITTLAEESYAYPNAVILHHQISATVFGRMNLTQQEEFFKESTRWWNRLATPIAEKMGITKDEMIKQMYSASSSGDWSEFAVEAQKLNWVNNIVSGIEETAILRSPDAAKPTKPATSTTRSELTGGVDENGKPVMYLPRISPKDVYFIYNPDGYYRTR